MNVLAIIPARAGSKRLPGKNRETVGGVPLWRRAVDCAKDAHATETVLVTDDEIIRDEAKRLGIRVFDEPPDVADDATSMASVLIWTLPRFTATFDAIVLLQPTSPLRTADDVLACLRIFQNSGCDSVVSVSDVGEHRYERNGAVYVTRPSVIRGGAVTAGWTQLYVMPPERSVDVDTAEDLAEARKHGGK